MDSSRSVTHHPSLIPNHVLGFGLVLLILLPIYLLTLQTQINGAEHYFMIDVGETQAVLNVWGTLHATGYPLYVMVSSGLVALLRDVFGLSAAAAPAVTSLIYGVMALGLFYALVIRVLATSYRLPASTEKLSANSDQLSAADEARLVPTNHSILFAVIVTICFGLLRTVWIHSVIAEIYAFGLVILLALLWIATPPFGNRTRHASSLQEGGHKSRIYLLALIGGVGVFHHRAIIMVAPALLVAVWGDVWHPAAKRLSRLLRALVLSVVIGLIGFLPYLYLPVRANADALWVYGDPGTWDGFWDQFTGREAARFIGTVQGWDGLLTNVGMVNGVLITDLTLPGVIAGLVGLLIALANPFRRRIAVILILNWLVPYLFHVTYYTDILSALILPILVSMALGWALLAEWVIWLGRRAHSRPTGRLRSAPLQSADKVYVRGRWTPIMASLQIAAAVVLGVALLVQNFPFIRDLTTDPTGLETIALAEQAPPGAALMLDWGPRYFAVAFAHDVEGKLPGITPVDHRADFPAIVQAEQPLLTPEFTFYNRPVSWWAERLGRPVYLHAVAPRLVQISTQPEQAVVTADRIAVGREQVMCSADSIRLDVAWIGPEPPARDYSVFVHLLDAAGNILAQADQATPVYGWRPVSGWLPGEIVRDVYAVERITEAVALRYGLYYQAADGAFVNDLERRVEVACGS
ncbi:MAG TPA: DUF2723 domain-containing protein [Aggregatilineales bacterium]|nr:DUF2723 domain-containing protein [Aggregatilineales bacterium]